MMGHSKDRDFDICVVGAGHAGIEAALVGARKGLKVALITTNLDRIGYMSCNPSIGGLGKGHMVREMDVLGGRMGRVADQTCVQFKRLNARKGPAVRGSRAQCDKTLYSQTMAQILQGTPGLTLIQGEAKSLILENGKCAGVFLEDGSPLRSSAVVLTTGTFMKAVIFLGLERLDGGRMGDKSTVGLSDQLGSLGFKVHRLKTGTPPRLHKDSINWDLVEPQYGDERFIPFSFLSKKETQLPQLACYLTRTTEKTHEILRRNLDQSPLFSGHIEGAGPRYCPSIEDKVTRFADKISHQTFLEPEGLNTDLIYLQGISTSMPLTVQQEFLETIPGLENVKIVRPGYAVEYDFIEPTQILPTLETRGLENLYLAGQINGTSGYEEAASQGLMAGLNASLKILGEEELVLRRDQAYIGVLIDDLVTKGTKEPYRMFTSRAEFRLVLREDNSLERLLEVSRRCGLLSEAELERAEKITEQRQELLKFLDGTTLTTTAETQEKLVRLGTTRLHKPAKLSELLQRSDVDMAKLKDFGVPDFEPWDVGEPVEIAVKYRGYIDRQNDFLEQSRRLDQMALPQDIDYSMIRGLRMEEIEKLSHLRPRTLGQAGRISGVNPSAVQAIMIFLKSRQPEARS